MLRNHRALVDHRWLRRALCARLETTRVGALSRRDRWTSVAYLRTLNDALSLSERLGGRVDVVGAGWIGLESGGRS